jgi:excisionase family DNA binding protein
MGAVKPASASLQRSKSLLTVEEVADRCSVSVRTVRRWIASRDLPVHRLGARNVRISEHDLAAFLSTHREA